VKVVTILQTECSCR